MHALSILFMVWMSAGAVPGASIKKAIQTKTRLSFWEKFPVNHLFVDSDRWHGMSSIVLCKSVCSVCDNSVRADLPILNGSMFCCVYYIYSDRIRFVFLLRSHSASQ